LIYLMGGDSLKDLYTWRNPLEFVGSVTALGVMVRPGVDIDLADLERQTPGLRAKVKYINAPLIGISASEIRQRVVHGLPYRYLVPPGVYNIIHERGIYRIK
jgi:nicotinate-nucleotide adenylyltransferase